MRGRPRGCCLLLGLLLAGCGLPADGTTRPVPSSDIPYRLLDPRPPAALPLPTPTGPVVTVPQVYFVSGEQLLVPRPFNVDAAGPGPVEDAVLAALSVGPTETERSQGLASALGPDVSVRLLGIDQGTARIGIETPSGAPSADRLPLAVGQVVLSAVSVEGIDRVLLFRDGQPLQAPLPGGEQTADPLTAADYASLLAPEAVRRKANPGTPTSSPTSTS